MVGELQVSCVVLFCHAFCVVVGLAFFCACLGICWFCLFFACVWVCLPFAFVFVLGFLFGGFFATIRFEVYVTRVCLGCLARIVCCRILRCYPLQNTNGQKCASGFIRAKSTLLRKSQNIRFVVPHCLIFVFSYLIWRVSFF